MYKLMLCVVGSLFSIACTAFAGQPSYLVFQIPDLPNEAVASSLTTVLDDGRCYGIWYDASGNSNAFVWTLTETNEYATGYTLLPDKLSLEVGDINIDGHWARQQWVWSAIENRSVPNAALWIPGQQQFAIGDLGGTSSAARGMSDTGYIVGWSETDGIDSAGNPIIQGFSWTVGGGIVATSFLSGYEHTSLNDVHPSGSIVVGTAWSNGIRDWAPLGDEVVFDNSLGLYLDDNGLSAPINNLLPVNSVWDISGANSVNSHHWIAGSAQGADGLLHAVLMIPNKADSDQNGQVDSSDLLAFLNGYSSTLSIADLNEDGLTDVQDLSLFIENYEEGTASGSGSISGGTFGGSPSGPARPVGVNCVAALASSCNSCADWNAEHPGWYDPNCNPDCKGCSGCNQRNPNKPDGAPGFDGDDPNNPDAPNGGPGGDGCTGGTVSGRPGNGGKGGDGDDDGTGGKGGKGADAEEGSGYAGGDGGDGGNGGAEGGDGGLGGDGGNGDGWGNGGDGGSGGNGGSEVGGDGGNAGDGGVGGNGGDLGGNGGGGGAGGQGGNSTGTGNTAGDGGNGGRGGQGNGAGTGGTGGRGGDGGESTNSNPGYGGGGGSGGSGGPGGSEGGTGGGGGTGGDGGSSDGSWNGGTPPPGPGGAGGSGGAGPGGTGPGGDGGSPGGDGGGGNPPGNDQPDYDDG